MTDVTAWLPWLTVALTVALLVLLWVRTKPPGSVEEAADQVAKMAELAKTAVQAAEQLWITGKLDKSTRYDYAFSLLAGSFPNVDSEQLRASIEAAVYWIKQVPTMRG